MIRVEWNGKIQGICWDFGILGMLKLLKLSFCELAGFLGWNTNITSLASYRYAYKSIYPILAI